MSYYGYPQGGYEMPYNGVPPMSQYPQANPYGQYPNQYPGGAVPGLTGCMRCNGTGYRMSKKGKIKRCKCMKYQGQYGYGSSDSD